MDNRAWGSNGTEQEPTSAAGPEALPQTGSVREGPRLQNSVRGFEKKNVPSVQSASHGKQAAARRDIC